MKKTVAIIGTRGYPSYYGGFETAVRKLAPYLADQGWDVSVYGRKHSTKMNDPLRDHRVRSVETPGLETKSLSTLSYGLSACVHAALSKPDVVLVMNVANGFWLPVLRLRGIPTLVNVDGIEWERAKWGRLAKAMFLNGARMTARFGTKLVCDARAIDDYWRNKFSRSGVFIPYGGDQVHDLPVEQGLIHRGYVLVVARFVPENTIPEFLDAIELISKSAQIVIVGSSGYAGDLEERVRRFAADSSRVKWLGHVSDDARLLSLWQHAGVYFHGHSVGGTNPALVQAMAAGAPIVARDTVYNVEVLGQAGHLTASDPQSIAAAVNELFVDPARQDQLSKLAVQRAESDYSWNDVCAAYEQELAALIASPNVSPVKQQRGDARAQSNSSKERNKA